MLVPASLYQAVFDRSPTPGYLLSPTPEAIILAVNDAFLTASVRQRDALVGVSLFTAFPQDPDDTQDTGEQALRASLARVRALGVPDALPTQRYPIRVATPDGQARFEERFWDAVSTPVFDAGGVLACILHSTIDVTDKIRAAAAGSESEKRFRALLTATAEVVYRMSPDWSYMHQLEGRGFLHDTTYLRHAWIDEYIPAEDHVMVFQAIGLAIRSKAPFELEHRVLRANGKFGWTYSRAVPMFDATGAIYEWIGAASDITARKHAEEKLRSADQRKDEFLAMLAHELRNPLAPIGAAADLLQMMQLDETRVRQTSQIISRQVRHMTSLIDDLLDVSRVTRGQVALDRAPLDIRQIAADAVEQVRPLIQARRHQLSMHLPPDATLVMGGKKRLVQVLANILDNAAKYTDEGGTIALDVGVQHGWVQIDVQDDGIGMAPQLESRAFDLFAQAQRSSDRSAGGLGLGLALVKSLVELHDGTVRCESAGLGAGCRFTVRLPCLAALDAPPAAPDSRAAMLPGAQGLTLMVVDDNVDAAAMLAMLLETMGHAVVVEHGSRQALERARAVAPQVFLLDIGLPDMDGNALAQRLRAREENRDAILIAVTGYGQDSDRKATLAAGFDHHFIKPVDMERLTALLADIAAARRASPSSAE